MQAGDIAEMSRHITTCIAGHVVLALHYSCTLCSKQGTVVYPKLKPAARPKLTALSVCLIAQEQLMVCFPSFPLHQRSSLHCRCQLPSNQEQQRRSAWQHAFEAAAVLLQVRRIVADFQSSAQRAYVLLLPIANVGRLLPAVDFCVTMPNCTQ